MIYYGNAKLSVSIKTRDFLDIDINKYDIKKHNVLSYHTGYNTFGYTPIDKINIINNNDTLYNCIIENTLGKQYEIICTENQKFYSRNSGYNITKYLGLSSILIDKENRDCKLISREIISLPNKNNKLFDIDVRYNYTYVCNGILMGSN